MKWTITLEKFLDVFHKKKVINVEKTLTQNPFREYLSYINPKPKNLGPF